MKKPAVLSDAEIAIISRAKEIGDPSLITDFFFRAPGRDSGWKFDENFEDKGKWQKKVHNAKQTDITIIGGFGTGKTSGIGMSAVVHCLTTDGFKFLNAAPTAWQSIQMYQYILQTAKNTRAEDLISEAPRGPWPKIVFRYKAGAYLLESSMEFMSVDRNGSSILTWEGDWFHIDEAGKLENLEEVIINVGSRLRGSVAGRPRLGRFSMTSNSWDNHELWRYFDLALEDSNNYLSLVLSTRDNKNVTEEQLKRMIQRIPEEERRRFIDGARPEGRGSYFSKEAIYACENDEGLFVQALVEKGTPGYKLEKLTGVGIYEYAQPPTPGAAYMFIGDPGIGEAPRRNAPVWIGWDVTEFPDKPARMIYFWWGNGFGKIAPFVDHYTWAADVYQPIFIGADSTSTQRHIAYLINEYVNLEALDTDKPRRPLAGLDFSGAKKTTYLHALRLILEAHLLSWPKKLSGIRSQLTNYDIEEDKKIAQDIVAVMAMSAHVIRTYFHVDVHSIYEAQTRADIDVVEAGRNIREENRGKRSETSRSSPGR